MLFYRIWDSGFVSADIRRCDCKQEQANPIASEDRLPSNIIHCALVGDDKKGLSGFLANTRRGRQHPNNEARSSFLLPALTMKMASGRFAPRSGRSISLMMRQRRAIILPPHQRE